MEAAAAELESHGQSFDDSPAESPAADPETPAAAESAPPVDDAAPAIEETPATPPAAEAAPEDELPVGGSIPVPRVRKILDNARAKARAEAEAKLKDLEWAGHLSRDEAHAAIEWYRQANADPVNFWRYATARLRSDPSTRDEIERLFMPSAPAQPQADPDPKPEPNVLLEDGRLVYDAAQQERLLSWQERRLEAKFRTMMEPVERATKVQLAEREAAAKSAQVVAEIKTWPGMSTPEHQKALAEAIASKRFPSIDAAYRAVIVPSLTPNASELEKRIREQVLAELKQKARATTAGPSRAGAAPDLRGKSIREIIELTAEEMGFTED
jgi:hypothetical protein